MTINNEKILDTFINKNQKLATDIHTSIKEVFNSEILKEIFSSEHRQIKYVIFENKCFIFDKLHELISVYINYNVQNNCVISSYDLERINTDKNAKLYLPAIANRNERYLNHKITTEELKNKMLPLVQEGAITQEMADEFINKRDILFNDYEYTFSNNIHDISLFIKFLQTQSYLTDLCHDEFILDLITKSSESYKDNFYYLSSSIHNMIECAVNNDMHSYETSAEFNDGDNHFWLSPLNTVIISTQTIMYCFCFKDLNNYDIYSFNTDEYSKELYQEYEKNYKSISFREFLVLNLEQKIQDNNIDLQDKVFSLVDNTVTFINPLFFDYLFSSLKHFIAFLKLNHDLREKYPEDVYSYNYQKKYFKHKYNLDEFKFLCHAFLTLGGDFDYDKETGRLVKFDIEYIHNLPELENKNDVSINQISYLYPQKVSFLNKDWTQGLIYLVEQLELNKPDFLAHDFKYKTKEEAFKKSIAYLKKVIKKNSKQLK